MRKTLLAMAMMGAFAASSAHANLVFVDKVDLTGTGLGNVPTILTITSPKNTTTEEGSVFAVGTGQGTSGDVIAQNHLRTFGELGYTEAGQIDIIYNPNEPQAAKFAGNKLESLTLNIYDPTGKAVFTSGSTLPLDIDALDAGTGKSGFRFRLDQFQTAAAETAIDTNGGVEGLYRIGLSAKVSGAEGGPETFFAQGVGAIPEPGTYAMMLAGLMAAGFLIRRRTQ